MKTPTKSDRKINSITSGRWTAYMAAAAASTFAGVGSAEAEIHYSGPVDVRLTGNAQASLPLSNGASLLFENGYGGSYYLQAASFLMKGVISGSARGYFAGGSGRNLLSNLRRRENVSAGTFLSVQGNPGFGVLFSFETGGFKPDAMGFVGFRFDISGNGTQYGWARIETRHDPHGRLRYIIKDYAWGDVGDAILTGQKQSVQSANTKSIPSSLGLLAFGSQGLDGWRAQRRQESN